MYRKEQEAKSESVKITIYPAVDLLGGRCVRLQQGRYDQVTIYHEDPLEAAESFRKAGASWIHVVDLDAARTGTPVHAEIIRRIRRETGLKVQTGGGIRTLDHIRSLLEDYAIERVILGTAAVKDQDLVQRALQIYREKIVIGIDARDGEVKVSGWTAGSGIRAYDLACRMSDMGVSNVIYTDIKRDGMLTGPATEDIRRLSKIPGLKIIASGGIGSIDDIVAVNKAGAAGVIVGKAIYEGKVRLEECWPKE